MNMPKRDAETRTYYYEAPTILCTYQSRALYLGYLPVADEQTTCLANHTRRYRYRYLSKTRLSSQNLSVLCNSQIDYKLTIIPHIHIIIVGKGTKLQQIKKILS